MFVGACFTLNYFRVQYYNDSIEGPSPETSLYWTIIHTQDLLHSPGQVDFSVMNKKHPAPSL